MGAGGGGGVRREKIESTTHGNPRTGERCT